MKSSLDRDQSTKCCNATMQDVANEKVHCDALRRALGIGPALMPDEPVRGLHQFVAASQKDATELWREVADTLDEAVIIVGPDRRIVYGNARAQKLMDLGSEGARGQSCLDVISCPQCACVCRLFEEGAVQDLEVTVYPPGESKPRFFRKNARLLRGVDGTVIGGVETLSDISVEVAERTEKQRRAELLFREKRRSSALVSSVTEGVISLDDKFRIREFSRQMSKLTGYSPEEARGAACFELLGLEPVPNEVPKSPIDATIKSKAGACVPVSISFLPMRFGSDELLAVVRPAGEPEDPVACAEKSHGFCGIISRSPEMREVLALVESVANSDASVLLEGESGTGKELVARAVHALGKRSGQPFFAVNCATFTESLLMSELFGHERGSFTGAVKRQRGKLELAGNGSLLLDEVSEMPPQHQAVLLRVLEERRFERVGGQGAIELGARVLAATNQDLQRAMTEGRFRRDLFHRLNVVPIRVPPLRERSGDIELLTDYFLHKAVRGTGNRPKQLSPDVRSAFETYPWPGNVRELENLIEYLSLSADELVTLEHLPAYLVETAPTEHREVNRAEGERERILAALRATNYRRAKAARLLGVDRSTLWRKLQKHGIELD